MAQETWYMDVESFADVASFPDIGTDDVFYVDDSSMSVDDIADLYIWDGNGYSFIGHRPKRPA